MKKTAHIFLLTIAAVFAGMPILQAQTTVVWSGEGANNLWSTGSAGGNWNGGAVPVNGDSLQFGLTDSNVAWLQRTNVNDLADLELGRITFNGGGWNISGNAITLTNNTPIVQERIWGNNNANTTISLDIHFAGTGTRTISRPSSAGSAPSTTLELSGRLTGTVELTYSINSVNASSVLLLSNNTNSFDGPLSMGASGGTVAVTSIANKGVNSAIGAGNTIAFIGGASTGNRQFSYRGTTDGSTDRDISLTALRVGNVLRFSNDSPNNSNLSFTGDITSVTSQNASSTPELRFQGTSTGISTFAPVIRNSSTGAVMRVQVDAAGTWVFTGNNTYTGTTTVTTGTLLLSGAGAIASSSELSVDSGATFSVASITADSYTFGAAQNVSGKGTIVSGGKDLALNGTLAAGTEDAGTLTFNLGAGALSLGSDVDLKFELGTLSDLIVLNSGVLNIGTGLDFNNFTFTALEGFGVGQYTLFQTAENIAGSLGLLTTGVIDGHFAELQIQGTNLTLNVVPEPTVAVLLGISLAAMLIFRRRI